MRTSFEQPPIELQERHTFDPTWASPWDMRCFWNLLEPRSCKVKSESSESQSCCYAWFNTMIRTYKRNVHTPVSLSDFLFLGQFMMYPKWWWSTGKFNQIWLEAKYEDKFWWTYPSFFGLPTWTVWRDLVILFIFGQNLTKEDLPKKDFRTFNFFPCSQCVPIMFPMCSQEHLGFIPYDFPQSSTPMCITWKGGLEGDTFFSIL